MASSKKRRKIVVFSIIGGVLIILAVVSVLRRGEPTITVQTDKVVRRNLTEIVVANGKVQPVMQVVISPEVAGEIVNLPVKEGDTVKKGDLLVQIKPDTYIASRNSAEASVQSAATARNLSKAQLDKAEAEYKRNLELFNNNLVSDSVFLEFKTTYEVAKLQYENAQHQEDQAKFGLDKAKDDLSKTTILAPMDGTVTRLQSQLGERVLGTSFNKGTEIMTIANLDQMEARVDIGEMDVVSIKTGQIARLEVDAFKDRKFTGVVTDIANSAKGMGAAAGGTGGQDATKFEVSILFNEKEVLRPGMSVTAEIETRYRTNALTVPFAAITTRPPKSTESKPGTSTNSVAASESPDPGTTATNTAAAQRKKDATKQIEVVFVVEGDHAKMVPVKSGISDDNYYEITEGLKEGDEIVSGNYRAIRDLEDGKKIVKGAGEKEPEKRSL